VSADRVLTPEQQASWDLYYRLERQRERTLRRRREAALREAERQAVVVASGDVAEINRQARLARRRMRARDARDVRADLREAEQWRLLWAKSSGEREKRNPNLRAELAEWEAQFKAKLAAEREAERARRVAAGLPPELTEAEWRAKSAERAAEREREVAARRRFQRMRQAAPLGRDWRGWRGEFV
jgi:hypothetical protein